MTHRSPQKAPSLRPDVRYRVVDGQAVVIVQEAGEALVLNAVGTRILELVNGRRSIDEIEERLGAEFEVEPRELARDVAAYLEELTAAGVVEA